MPRHCYSEKPTTAQIKRKKTSDSILLMALGLILLAACSAPQRTTLAEIPGPRGTLTIEVVGFRSLQGDLLVSIFRESEGFPDESDQALINISTPVLAGRQQLEFPPLPWGRYSYSILHDENGNGEMDRNLIGVPREGYAFSNNLEGHFGQPEAEEALFAVGAAPEHHKLRIHYFKRKGQGPFGK